jgi:GntR family transcriptional regulator, arabinose operon transcriptional repressor
MQNKAPGKQSFVYNELSKAIRLGRFRKSGRLPSDRDLAKEFGVSYMTVRRAVNQLVSDRVIERRSRRGTFICQPAALRSKKEMRLNIICTAQESQTEDRFIQLSMEHAKKIGWATKVIRVSKEDEKLAANAILGPDCSLVHMNPYFGWTTVSQALVAAADRTALIGMRMDEQGVLSIIGDDARSMRMSIQYLADAGHTRTGLVIHHPGLRPARLRMAAWNAEQRNQWSTEEIRNRLIIVDIPPYASHAERAYDAVSKYLASGKCDVTALICINDWVGLGVMAACRDAGLSVPSDMSIICLSNTEFSRLAAIPMTCAEINRAESIDIAFKLLNQRLSGELPEWDCLQLIRPRLIERESVAVIKPGKSLAGSKAENIA